MIVTDPVSGCSFDAFTPWLASLRFVDVQPYVCTSNPKTSFYPSVSVTWGRKVDCVGGPACGVGERHEYCLSLDASGRLVAQHISSGGNAGWCGKCRYDASLATVPSGVKRLALSALRAERSRRFDGCTYVGSEQA